jgi:hypothetical protein
MRDKDPLPKSKPDPEEIEHSASSEEVLDYGIQETFPASDPIAIGTAYASARRREKRRHPV